MGLETSSDPSRRNWKTRMPESAWQKSSYSASSNECVELRTVAGAVELR
ncbi:DUF397 domain-containing protein, partial [Kitasatospora sp. NPDC127116]